LLGGTRTRNAQKAGASWPVAGLAIKRLELRLKVDVKPLKVVVPGNLGCPFQERQGETRAAELWMDAGVKDEAMNTAIPRHVDEAD